MRYKKKIIVGEREYEIVISIGTDDGRVFINACVSGNKFLRIANDENCVKSVVDYGHEEQGIKMVEDRIMMKIKRAEEAIERMHKTIDNTKNALVSRGYEKY